MYSTPGGPAEHGRHEWVLWHPSGNQRNGLFQHSPSHAGQLTNEPTGEHPLSVCLIDCSPARNYTERVRESGRGGKERVGDWQRRKTEGARLPCMWWETSSSHKKKLPSLWCRQRRKRLLSLWLLTAWGKSSSKKHTHDIIISVLLRPHDSVKTNLETLGLRFGTVPLTPPSLCTTVIHTFQSNFSNV